MSGVPKFPAMLRKMWSGGEVQDWIDRNLGPLAEDGLRWRKHKDAIDTANRMLDAAAPTILARLKLQDAVEDIQA